MIAQLLATPGVKEALIAETPLGALPEIEDVANAVLYLASDESAFVTGENVHVDGGGALRRLPRTDDILSSIRRAMEEQSD